MRRSWGAAAVRAAIRWGPDPTYAEVVADGWASFLAGDYAAATRHFTDALALDDAQAEAYSGLGWTSLQLEDPIPAAQSFSEGSTRTGDSQALADLYAGWAFATNALKDPTGVTTDAYTDSNTRAAEALARDAAWSFTHGLGLDRGDLIVLRAENFFALGEFRVQPGRGADSRRRLHGGHRNAGGAGGSRGADRVPEERGRGVDSSPGISWSPQTTGWARSTDDPASA